MKAADLRNASCLVAILLIATFTGLSSATASAQSQPTRGDGIFTPIISPVAIDKTGRPFTVEAAQPEPRFAGIMVAGKPTGDSYVINFPTGNAGGSCTYTGTARYFIESTGTLTFQMLSTCGNLRRGYSYMICRLDESLRCSEAPWWYFRDRTFAVTDRGVVINGATVYPWKDAAGASPQLQTIAARIKSMGDRFRSDPQTAHSRLISCRTFHPSTRSYAISEFPTTCLIKSLCNGMPNVDSLRDGDPIDWNSPVGTYLKEGNKLPDIPDSVCWIRTQ